MAYKWDEWDINGIINRIYTWDDMNERYIYIYKWNINGMTMIWIPSHNWTWLAEKSRHEKWRFFRWEIIEPNVGISSTPFDCQRMIDGMLKNNKMMGWLGWPTFLDDLWKQIEAYCSHCFRLLEHKHAEDDVEQSQGTCADSAWQVELRFLLSNHMFM